MRALVTEAQWPASVAGLRGLGRAGIGAIAMAPSRGAAGLWSRYALGRAQSPDPRVDRFGHVREVSAFASAHGPLVPYPGTEDGIEALVSHGAETSDRLTLPYPGVAPVTRIRDKGSLGGLAEAAGLRSPRTLMAGSAEELIGDSVPVPCVIKPALPSGGGRGARAISSRVQLERLLDAGALPAGEPLLVQELVRGRLISVELVVDRSGAVVERFQAVAHRTSPSAAGLISLATSVEPDEELVHRIGGMLADAGYWGLAQLDLIADGSDMVLLDANPRFYSCLPLSLACGVNLPAAWHSVVLERPVGSPSSYRTGEHFRWLEGELVEAVKGERRRLWSHPRPLAAGAMWAGDDPVPGLLLAGAAVRGRARRVLRR